MFTSQGVLIPRGVDSEIETSARAASDERASSSRLSITLHGRERDSSGVEVFSVRLVPRAGENVDFGAPTDVLKTDLIED